MRQKLFQFPVSHFMFAPLVFFTACPAQKPAEPPAPRDQTSPPAAAQVTPAPRRTDEKLVAILEQLVPRVTFRRREEGVWQEAAQGLSLFNLDAVQTHSGATAKLEFTSGSRMDVSQNSLVIINGRASGGDAPDRAVVRNGKLDGQTPKELWILTSAALVRLRSDAAGKTARALVDIQEGKTLNVTLVDGKGTMTKASPNGGEAKLMVLKPKKTVTVAAPVATETFGYNENETKWEAPAPQERKVASSPPVTTAPPSTLPVAPLAEAKKQAEPPPLDVFITSPPDYSEVSGASVEMTGRATGGGGKIFVNGQQVSVNENHEFSTNIALKEGTNSIVIQLVRPKGDSVFRRWTVLRNN